MKASSTCFICAECGREVLRFPVTDDILCAHCLHFPGWFRDPLARAAIDPSHSGKDPAEAPATAEGGK